MSTIYTLSIECVYGTYLEEPFIRVVEVPFDMTLDDLHEYILKLTKFDHEHLSDFYISSSPNGIKKWFGGNDEYYDVPLNQVYPLPKHKKLYYIYDFGDNWTFEIRRKSSGKKAIHGTKYPRIIKSEGPMPEQYPSFGYE
jgi:hypothetical protein